MPFGGALTLGLSSVAGAGMSSGKGKKASNKQAELAQQQLGIQQQQVGLEQQAFGQSQKAFTPAFNYWNSLLQGGQPARVAVGPIAGDISKASTAQQQNILNTLPAGGERNLALANAKIQSASDTARLYAGVQPAAATALGNLASFTGSQAVGFGGAAGASPYAAYAATAANQAQIAQGASGFGSLLYNAFQKYQNRPMNSTPGSGLDVMNTLGVTSPASTSGSGGFSLLPQGSP